MDTRPSSPEFLRLIFTDITGITRSIELGFDRLHEVVNEGVFFDGSSVPGYAAVNSSDLMLRPRTAMPTVLPWDPDVGLLVCSVYEPSGKPHSGDPRHVLRRIVEDAFEDGYMLKVGSELEFFLVRTHIQSHMTPADQGGYFSTPPSDGAVRFRRGVVRALHKIGIATTTHHHEVAKGQQEIGLSHGPAYEIADDIMLTKLVISEMALEIGLIATFMPKPFFSSNGSGMHLHQSLWDIFDMTNLFAVEEPRILSEIAGHYVAGLFEHAGALSAILSPTVNSFKRLVPGFEAPTRVAWGHRNRTTMVRIPEFNGRKSQARIELRCPDPLCSPHLALAAILAAGMDGIRKELEPSALTSADLYEEVSEVPTLPESLADAIDELARDSTLKTVLGENTVETIVRLRLAEWNDYIECTEDITSGAITDWEIERYLCVN